MQNMLFICLDVAYTGRHQPVPDIQQTILLAASGGFWQNQNVLKIQRLQAARQGANNEAIG